MNEQITVAHGAADLAVGRTISWAEELRATFALAWPLVIAQLAQNALHTTDVILLGWLGPAQLAAGTLATTFLMPFLVAGVGIVGAVAPLVAQARGARDIKAVRRIVRQGCWAAMVLAAVMVPLVLQIRPIYLALGQDPVVAFRSLLSAFNTTRAILVITVAGVLLNAAIAYTLIFGNFGFPRLELRGAATATLITNLAMLLMMAIYVVRHPRLKRFHVLLRFWHPDWPRFREIFRVGLPIGLTVLAEVGLFTAAAILMGRLGTDEIAAHAIALQCASLAFMVPLGVGTAATVRVGTAYGRSDPDGVRKAGWTAFVMGTGFMVLTCITFLTAGPSVVGLFLNSHVPANANALSLAATFLVVAGVFQIVDGAQVVAAHALRGLSDTKVPMLLAILGYWVVGLPIAYVLGLVVGWRGVGIWIGLAAGLAFVALVLVTRFALRERLGLLRSR